MAPIATQCQIQGVRCIRSCRGCQGGNTDLGREEILSECDGQRGADPHDLRKNENDKPIKVLGTTEVYPDHGPKPSFNRLLDLIP